MNNLRKTVRSGFPLVVGVTLALAVPLTGCGPNYLELRRQGQSAMLGGRYGPALYFFEEAEALYPRIVDNLRDLGACSVMLAREKFKQMNHAAAMRELDAAVAYYTQALEVRPDHQACIEGLNVALELKGKFDEALERAEWTATFVGPSARQYIFLAGELDERGDVDGALLRYRQAVAVEPQNATGHVAFAKFLLRHGNETAAIHHLQVAYRVNPLDEWVMDQLASRSALPTLTTGDDEAP